MPLIEPTAIHDANIQPYQSLLRSFDSAIRPAKRQRIEVANEAQVAPNPKAQTSDELPIRRVNAEIDSNDDEDGSSIACKDPFNMHFAETEAEDLSNKITALQQGQWASKRSDGAARWSIWSSYPKAHGNEAGRLARNPMQSNPKGLALKKRIRERALSIVSNADTVTKSVCDLVFNYADVLFPLRSESNASSLRHLVCIHTLNHMLKTRDQVIKNNSKISGNDLDADLEARDQGFTRPKVLVMLPTRQACVRYVDALISLFDPEQQENKKRFMDSFSSPLGDLSAEKPADFRELFEGNDDDLFRLGIKFTRKTIKFFSKFYNSDIIFASPLGLRMAISKSDGNTSDYDFLSSIEVLVLDQADALFMQNWEHVEYITEHIGLQPKKAHGCDFGRVRHWYLDGNAKYVRQTIAISAYNFVPLNQMFINKMLNFAGKHKYLSDTEGIMTQSPIMPKQTFHRFRYSDINNEPDARFDYFTQAVLPTMVERQDSSRGSQGLLVLIPTYAEFLRIRNHLASAADMQHVSFGAISEYTPVKEVARARAHFLSGRHSVLLYTERVHHFRRYHLKGVKRVVIYTLPENPKFYKEIAGDFLQSSLESGVVGLRDLYVKVLFSRLDVLKLERIVGTERSRALLHEQEDTFEFLG